MSEEITTNAQGGKQSRTDTRYDLFPALAWERVAQVLAEGAGKYTPNNWRLIDEASHLDHALRHIAKLQQGDQTEDHAGHAACRIMMWLEQRIATGELYSYNSIPVVPPEPQAKEPPTICHLCGDKLGPDMWRDVDAYAYCSDRCRISHGSYTENRLCNQVSADRKGADRWK